jgi:TPP-dependent pyruvate/acetoin dehydrogenase alpha subunit
VILTAETFRMGGHATHDEHEARVVIPDGVFERWGARDPVGLYEEYLKADGVATEALQRVEIEVSAEVDAGADEALASRETYTPRGETALEDVYAPST